MAVFKLYHWEPNANSGKPIQTLMEKGVEFESCWIDVFAHDHHKPEYLAINPLGVVPAAVHGELKLYESTAIMEYVDAAFEGPKLRPDEPAARWRMRWWMKFVDEYYAPSVSMGAWGRNRGATAQLQRSPEEIEALKKQIAAIPQKERQVSWTKTLFGTFTDEEMAESERKTVFGAKLMERALERSEWLAGDGFSLADINAFNLCYFMPMRPDGLVSDATTPRTMEWLRKICERPATRKSWDLGRAFKADRLTHLERRAS